MRTFFAGNRMKRMMGKNAAGRSVLRTVYWLLGYRLLGRAAEGCFELEANPDN